MKKVIIIMLFVLMLSSTASAAYQGWEYNGYDIPEAGNEKFYLNLWVYEYDYPREEVEIVLSDFTFTGDNIKKAEPDWDRTFYWSGYEWSVREPGAGSPGPNYWSDSTDNVWVEDDKLHLKITYRDGKWYCPEVVSVDSLGYGEYSFTVESDLSDLPKGVVFAGFTYLDDDNEVDIEFSKWGEEDNSWDTQYVVQPASKSGNYEYFFTEESYASTHLINWQPDSISFSSKYNKETNLPVPEADTKTSDVTTKTDETIIDMSAHDTNTADEDADDTDIGAEQIAENEQTANGVSIDDDTVRVVVNWLYTFIHALSSS